MLNALAGLVKRYSSPEFSVVHGGHVQTIAAGNYTVSGLSRHVRLGEFVAHRSPTGIHLGEVVRVEPDSVVVCPIEPGEPISIHDTVIRKGAFRVAPAASWCGRTINALGEPIDGLGPLVQGDDRRSIYNSAPPSMTRKRVEKGFSTGVRAIDIREPYSPKEVGYYIPSVNAFTFANGGKFAIQTNNVEVDDRGLIYTADRAGTGMHILRLTGSAASIIAP